MASPDGVYVQIGADTKVFEAALDEMKDMLDETAQGLQAAGVAMSALLTAPILAGVGAAVKAGIDIDDAFDRIRAKTGQTGAALQSLEESFTAVFANVPDSAEAVSTAIADLNTRTGQMGPGLERLATQFLALARLTGEQLGPMIQQTTRLFGDWSIAVEKQSPAMDLLYRVSQQTGVAFGTLAERLTQYGAPLRQLGLSFEQSAVMIGKFEKEGVNVELVLGAMRTALAKFGAAGKEPVEAFRQLVDAIKNSDTATGNLIAKQATNAKVFADFAAAVREGRHDFDKLLESIMKGGDTIEKAAKDTSGFAEAWGEFRNQMTAALEPIGTTLLMLGENIVKSLSPVAGIVSLLAKGFSELSPVTQTIIVAFAAFVAAVGPVLVALGAIASGVAALTGVAGVAALVLALKAVAIAAGVAAAAFAAFKWAEWLASGVIHKYRYI